MSEHLPLNALKAFEAAARHLSFSKAADELHVTPAAVSQQIRALESQLGVKLFNRLNRALTLTDDGAAGLDKLREGFDALSHGVQLIRRRQRRASLNVWSPPSFASKWLLPRLPQFAREHDDIDIHVDASVELIGDGTPMASQLRQHEVDAAIRFGHGRYPDCRVDKLLDVEVVPLCSPALLAGAEALASPAELRRFTLLHDDTAYEGRPSWQRWLDAVGEHGVDAERGLHFNQVSLTLQAAIDGQGVALSLLPLAEADIAAGRLAIAYDYRLPLDIAYYLLSPKAVADRDEVRAFRVWLLAAQTPSAAATAAAV